MPNLTASKQGEESADATELSLNARWPDSKRATRALSRESIILASVRKDQRVIHLAFPARFSETFMKRRLL